MSRPSVKAWRTRSGTPRLSAEPDQRLEMLEPGMHPAVRHESDQVHALGGGRARSAAPRFSASSPAPDCVVDARQILHHDRARAEAEVAHLRIAHLAIREADRAARRRQTRVRVARPQLVEHRRVRPGDRIAGSARRDPPPVEDDQNGAGGHQVGAGLRVISPGSAGGHRLGGLERHREPPLRAAASPRSARATPRRRSRRA